MKSRAVTTCLRHLLGIAGLLLMLLAGAARADVVTYFHNDISGTPLAATDEGGNLLWKETYRPYGERLLNGAGPDANRLWFGGKPQDPDTGLSYLGARYYSPQLGRFVGVDPKAVDPENLHSFNRYAYGNNNPYKFGRSGREKSAALGGGRSGVVVGGCASADAGLAAGVRHGRAGQPPRPQRGGRGRQGIGRGRHGDPHPGEDRHQGGSRDSCEGTTYYNKGH
jgi:RHS repeat-associated protein